MHLLCGGIYNNHIIANYLQSVPVKEFWKLFNNFILFIYFNFLWPMVYIEANILGENKYLVQKPFVKR